MDAVAMIHIFHAFHNPLAQKCFSSRGWVEQIPGARRRRRAVSRAPVSEADFGGSHERSPQPIVRNTASSSWQIEGAVDLYEHGSTKLPDLDETHSFPIWTQRSDAMMRAGR